jgi:hypothetical protein
VKLNEFTGGLSTRLDPTLIGPNEAVQFTNVDNAKGNLTSIKDYLLSGVSIDRWFYLFDNKWYSSINDREYLEYKSKLYWVEKQNVARKVVRGVEKDLGIKAPTVKLTSVINNTGSITATTTAVQYMYTYYDSSEGIESAPSPISDELALVATKSVDLSGFQPSGNIYVDTIRLYRVGADTTDFTLLIELPISTTTYNDNIPTLSALGDILESYDYQPPRIGIRYIIEAYGILFAAIDNEVVYTEIGLPDAWPIFNNVVISGDVTGLVAISDGIVIFTKDKAYLLVGTEPSSFRVILLSPEHGCINHNTIKVVKNTLLWTSADGICALSGSSISVITKDKLGRITFDSISATVYSEQYMLTLTNGSVFIADLRFNMSFKDFKYIDADVYNLGVFDNKLYGVVKEQLALIDEGVPIDLYYTSPRLTEGDASVIKMYNNVYIRALGRFLIDILINGKVVCSEEIIGNDVFDIKVPQEQQRGSDIQFKVEGTGTVYEIEYKTVGRENGR